MQQDIPFLTRNCKSVDNGVLNMTMCMSPPLTAGVDAQVQSTKDGWILNLCCTLNGGNVSCRNTQENKVNGRD